ncbi:MAG: hypothetical protein ABI743_13455, partial [bacterium]
MSSLTAVERQLWAGPPGSGKTTRLFSEFAAALDTPGIDPAHVVLILPNAETVRVATEALLALRGGRAFALSSLIPLSRLAIECLDPAPTVLSSLSQSLLIRDALQQIHNASNAAWFDPQHAGVRIAVAEYIAECKGAGFLPDAAETLGLALPGELDWPTFPWSRLDQLASARHRSLLAHFRQVWARYETLKARDGFHGYDTEDLCLQACAAIEALPLDDRYDWIGIDGFTEFTALQWRLLQGLMRRARVVRLTLSTDLAESPWFLRKEDPRYWIAAAAQDPQHAALTLTGFGDP